MIQKMMLKIIIRKSFSLESLLTVLFVFCISCSNQTSTNSIFYTYLNKIESSWTIEEKNEFISKEKNDAIYYALTKKNLGLDEWWYKKKVHSELISFFYSKGIYEGGDMTKIIFFSLHDKLKKTEINIELYTSLLKKEHKKNKKQKQERSVLTHGKHSLSDTVFVQMPMDSILFGSNNVGEFGSEFDPWIFNKKRDLLVKGIVIDKSKEFDSAFHFFKIKVLSMNKHNVKLFSKPINIEDEIVIDLKNNYVTPAR